MTSHIRCHQRAQPLQPRPASTQTDSHSAPSHQGMGTRRSRQLRGGRYRMSSASQSTVSTPLRICTLLPSATEIVYSLGLGPNVVGVTHECDYPEPQASICNIARRCSPSPPPHLLHTVIPASHPCHSRESGNLILQIHDAMLNNYRLRRPRHCGLDPQSRGAVPGGHHRHSSISSPSFPRKRETTG